MTSALILIGLFAACGLLLWASTKIEPHWVSRQGDRVVCSGQAIDRMGLARGRWREVRVTKIDDDVVEVRPRHGGFGNDRASSREDNYGVRVEDEIKPDMALFGSGKRPKRVRASHWKVAGATPDPPRRKAIYLLDNPADEGQPEMLAIRLPADSKAIPMLESVARNKTR